MLEHVNRPGTGEVVNRPIWERDFGDGVSTFVEVRGINPNLLKINITSSGTLAGSADIYIKPMQNEASIINLKVFVENRRQGLGHKLIQSINDFLDEERLDGTLVDGTTDKNLSDFYLKNGWRYEEEGSSIMYRVCNTMKGS